MGRPGWLLQQIRGLSQPSEQIQKYTCIQLTSEYVSVTEEHLLPLVERKKKVMIFKASSLRKGNDAVIQFQ